MVTIFVALLLGVMQGILEWLPISSEGNVTLIMVVLLGTEPAEALELAIYLHIGSGLAALVYFRRDIVQILSSDSKTSRGLFSFLVVATALTGVVGLPLFLFAQSINLGTMLVGLTGIALVSTGLVQRSVGKLGVRDRGSLNSADSFLLGIIQGLSAIPGVSRSGITTAALLFRGLSGNEALRVSFLMSIPAVFAASLGLALLEGIPSPEVSFFAAIIASFLTSLLFMDILLRVSRRIRFWTLCVTLGAIVLLSLALSLIR